MPKADVVIVARNEEATIGPIVYTFASSPAVERIIVVVDVKTKDETGYLATTYGATHVIFADTTGKGQLMQAGLGEVKTRRVIFCDADIYGLTVSHVDILANAAGHTIGVPDQPVLNPYPATLRRLRESWPWLSGQRSLATVVAAKIDLHGYLAEVQINETCRARGIAPFLIPLRGLYSPIVMSKKRLDDMERDRRWGIERGILNYNRVGIGG